MGTGTTTTLHLWCQVTRCVIPLLTLLSGCPDPEIIEDPFEAAIRFVTPVNQDVFGELDRLELTFFYTGQEPKNFVIDPPFGSHPLNDLPRAAAGDVRLEVAGLVESPGSVDGWELAARGEASGFALPTEEGNDIEVFLALKGQIGLLPGGLLAPRYDARAVLLPDGRVLVVGGLDEDGPVATVETLLDDPDDLTSGDGVQGTARGELPRVAHSAFLIEDTGSDFDGQVIVLGGDMECTAFYCSPPHAQATDVVAFDPVAETFETVDELSEGIVAAQSAVIDDDRVAVIGGFPNESVYQSRPLLFDPHEGTVVTSNYQVSTREQHAVTSLGEPGSAVLITGGVGNYLSQVQVLPTADLWEPGGSPGTTGSMNEARMRHTATLLRDGTVLVAGGAVSDATGFQNDWDSPGDPLASAELFTPSADTFELLADTLNYARQRHVAVRLAGDDDRVLFCGGVDEAGGAAVPFCEVFDRDSGTFEVLDGPPLEPGGGAMNAVPLEDGRVLLFGGSSYGEAWGEVYVYTP